MKIFIVFSILTFSHFCFSQDIDCNQFQQTIMQKIEDNYNSSMQQASGNGIGCMDFTSLVEEGGNRMKNNCISKVFEAIKHCDQVGFNLEKKGLSKAKGAGHQSANGTKGITQSTQDFWQENKKCGRKLASIPPSCRSTSQSNRDELVGRGCTPVQIKQVKDNAMEKAPPIIMKYCGALAKHYKRAQQVVQNRGAASRNLSRTNKKTFDRSGQ